MIKTSHQDTERYLELNKDRQAAERVFQSACQHYHNALNSIAGSERLMWDHLREAYWLDPTKEYAIMYDNLERRAIIKEGDV